MSDGRPNGADYRAARQVSALLLIGTGALIVLADSLNIGRTVDPLVLAGIWLTAAGLLSVDLPALRR